jgi:hypothetical protein
MATARRGSYIYTTWITGLLAGDDHCRWAAWFRAHFQHEAVGRTDGNLAKWKAEHGAMVDARVASLIADGWTVFLEAQNKFTLAGKAAVLAGVPDIVAVRDQEGLVVDCKSGQPRDKDFWQVCIYLLVLPLVHPACKDRRLVGEIEYRDHALLIQPEEFTLAMREQITAQIRETGSSTPPGRVPSFRECQFCSIGKVDCPDRIERRVEQEVVHELF